MGKSQPVNSSNNGNWIFENTLTEEGKNVKFDFLSNVIDRFVKTTKHLKKDHNVEISEVHVDKKKQNEFNLPDITIKYDLYNSKRFSKKIQNWQGVILSVDAESFTAKMIDLTNGGTYEIGEFDLNDVSPEDNSLLVLGGIFYWSVGHYMENGQSVKRSEIRFQRLITLEEEDINSVSESIVLKYSKLKEKK